NDLTDYANGATDFYNDRIEIFASALDFEFRGTHNWLRNVITHEYTHMVTLQSSMKLPKMMPAIYVQWLNYEKEKRPDVLYGYPNGIVSYPISGVAVPSWFAEGVAQYQRQQLGYEKWDAQRDMILRSRVVAGDMLSYNEMGQFSTINSLKAESIYNSGFALVRYISKTYGEDKLKKLVDHLSDLDNFSMDAAFRSSVGKDGSDVYKEWKDYLEKDYSKRLSGVKETKIEGDLIQKEDFANLNPKFSPDGKWIAFMSNEGTDFFSTQMYLYNTETKTKIPLPFTSGSNFNWSPDSKKIIYAQKQIPPSLKEISLFDLYEYDLQQHSVRKMTDNSRYTTPAYSYDGKKIVFLVPNDGTMNMKIADYNLTN
ncbi:MAG TPA: biopolymer transporter Tol, partial [Ignavibacteria bacterium]|nr:biopolymer transporter Tol [Ignavibacteria bacterium]